MTDIVERLLYWVDEHQHGAQPGGYLMREAADEIERLMAEVERLRATMNDIANSMGRDWIDPAEHANWCIERAKGDNK